MITEYVQLVDQNDKPVGVMEKLEAHLQAKLHRAISIFVFNSKGELLLQKRAPHKYHSGDLWTNTCCSHPRPNESNIDAANRRLQEEMGLTCDLNHQFSFSYKAALDNDLTEHEFDHVFFGVTDTLPLINLNEASAWKYMSLAQTEKLLTENPTIFTEWFKIIFGRVKQIRL